MPQVLSRFAEVEGKGVCQEMMAKADLAVAVLAQSFVLVDTR